MSVKQLEPTKDQESNSSRPSGAVVDRSWRRRHASSDAMELMDAETEAASWRCMAASPGWLRYAASRPQFLAVPADDARVVFAPFDARNLLVYAPFRVVTDCALMDGAQLHARVACAVRTAASRAVPPIVTRADEFVRRFGCKNRGTDGDDDGDGGGDVSIIIPENASTHAEMFHVFTLDQAWQARFQNAAVIPLAVCEPASLRNACIAQCTPQFGRWKRWEDAIARDIVESGTHDAWPNTTEREWNDTGFAAVCVERGLWWNVEGLVRHFAVLYEVPAACECCSCSQTTTPNSQKWRWRLCANTRVRFVYVKNVTAHPPDYSRRARVSVEWYDLASGRDAAQSTSANQGAVDDADAQRRITLIATRAAFNTASEDGDNWWTASVQAPHLEDVPLLPHTDAHHAFRALTETARQFLEISMLHALAERMRFYDPKGNRGEDAANEAVITVFCDNEAERDELANANRVGESDGNGGNDEGDVAMTTGQLCTLVRTAQFVRGDAGEDSAHMWDLCPAVRRGEECGLSFSVAREESEEEGNHVDGTNLPRAFVYERDPIHGKEDVLFTTYALLSQHLWGFHDVGVNPAGETDNDQY